MKSSSPEDRLLFLLTFGTCESTTSHGSRHRSMVTAGTTGNVRGWQCVFPCLHLAMLRPLALSNQSQCESDR